MALTDEYKKEILFNFLTTFPVIQFLRLTLIIAAFHLSSLLIADNKIFAMM